MPDAVQHAVNRLIMDFSLAAGADYTEFQHRFSEACRQALIPALEKLFDQYGVDDHHWVFDHIEIDAGFLRQDYLVEDLVAAVITQLEEILRDVSVGIEYPEAKVVPARTSDLSLFAQYLETGALSWPAPPQLNPDQLTERVTGSSPNETAVVVRRLGQAARVRRRIAWQLADPSVRAIVRTLAPADYPFIADYADDLADLHQKKKLIEAGEKEFRKAHWEFILQFLLVEKHTDFEALQLARSSVKQMAAHYNLNYGEVLHFLGAVISAESQSLAQRTNLPQLLALLQKEFYTESGTAPPADSLIWLLGAPGLPAAPGLTAEKTQWEPQWKQRLAEIESGSAEALPPSERERFVIHLLDWKKEEVLMHLRESLRDETGMRRLFASLSPSLVKEIVFRLGAAAPWALQWYERWSQWLRSPASPHADRPELQKEALLQLALGLFHPGASPGEVNAWEEVAAGKEVFRSFVQQQKQETGAITASGLPLWLTVLEAWLGGRALPAQMTAGQLAQQFSSWAFEQPQAARQWLESATERGAGLEVWVQKMPLSTLMLALRLLHVEAFAFLRLHEGRMLSALRGTSLTEAESIRLRFWQWALTQPAAFSRKTAAGEQQWRDSLARQLPLWMQEAGLRPAQDWERKWNEPFSTVEEDALNPFEWTVLPADWQLPGLLLEWMQSANEVQRRNAQRILSKSGIEGAAARRLTEEGAESAEWLVRWMSGGEWKAVAGEVNAWLHYLLQSPLREGTEAEVRQRLWRTAARQLSDWRPGPYDSPGFLAALRRQIAEAFQLSPEEVAAPETGLSFTLPEPPEVFQQKLLAALQQVSTLNEEERQEAVMALQSLILYYPHRVRALLQGLPPAALQVVMDLTPPAARQELVAALEPRQSAAVAAFLQLARATQERSRLTAGSTAAFESQVFLFVLIYLSRPGAGAFSVAAFLEAMMWQLAALTGQSAAAVTAAFAAQAEVQAPGADLTVLAQQLSSIVPVVEQATPAVPARLLETETRMQWIREAGAAQRSVVLQVLAPALLQPAQEYLSSLLKLAASAGLSPAALAQLEESLWMRLFTFLLSQPDAAFQQRALWMELLKGAMDSMPEHAEATSWLDTSQHAGLSAPVRTALQSLLHDVQVQQWAALQRKQRETAGTLGKKGEGTQWTTVLFQYLQEGALSGSMTTGMLRQMLSRQLGFAPQAVVDWLKRQVPGSAAWERLLSLLQAAELRALLLHLQTELAPLWLDLLDALEGAAQRLSFAAGHSPQGFREELRSFVLKHSAGEGSLTWVAALPQLMHALAVQAGSSPEKVARALTEAVEVLRPWFRSGGTAALITPAIAELATTVEPPLSDAEKERKPGFDYDQWEGPEDWPYRKRKRETASGEEEISWLVPNAGIVLVWPYLRTLFERAGTMEAGQFHDETAQWRSVYLLRYLTHQDKETHEPDLILNKVLCGLPVEEPPPAVFELTEAQKQLCANMLTGVIGNWPILGVVPNDTLREGFLVREGVLRREEANWHLKVEQKTYDVLLTELPWGIGTVSLSWMKELILVEWWK